MCKSPKNTNASPRSSPNSARRHGSSPTREPRREPRSCAGLSRRATTLSGDCALKISRAGAGAKQRTAKEEAVAGMKLKHDLDAWRLSESLEAEQHQQRRASIATARRTKASVAEEGEGDEQAHMEYV